MPLRVPDTKGKLVTSYIIYDKNHNKIGFLQNLNPAETRAISETFEIDADRDGVPTELVPGLVKDKRFTSDRFSLYEKNVLEAYGGESGIMTLADQMVKFDVEEVIKRTIGGTITETVQKRYIDCWIADYGATRDITGDIRETERVTVNYRDVAVPPKT